MGCKSWLFLMLALVTNQHLPVANGWSLVDYNSEKNQVFEKIFRKSIFQENINLFSEWIPSNATIVPIRKYRQMSSIRAWGSILYREKCRETRWKLSTLEINSSKCLKELTKPEHRSTISRISILQKYSKYAYQYQHDVLTRGVCVEACRKLVENLRDQQQFRQPKFDVEFKVMTPVIDRAEWLSALDRA